MTMALAEVRNVKHYDWNHPADPQKNQQKAYVIFIQFVSLSEWDLNDMVAIARPETDKQVSKVGGNPCTCLPKLQASCNDIMLDLYREMRVCAPPELPRPVVHLWSFKGSLMVSRVCVILTKIEVRSKLKLELRGRKRSSNNVVLMMYFLEKVVREFSKLGQRLID